MTTCFSNPTPTFQPALRIISSITNANPAKVKTTLAHDYITGEIVRLKIPKGFGMPRANNLLGVVTITSEDEFTINIDTSRFESFSPPFPLPPPFTCAQVIPVGEISSLLAGATKNVSKTGER